MLSSTNRRILNVISVSLAIVAMVIGLTMKYTIEKPILEAQSDGPEVELVSYSDSIQHEIEELGEPN